MFIRARLQYYDEQGLHVTNKKKIQRRYFCSWNQFPLDVVTALPYEIGSAFVTGESDAS